MAFGILQLRLWDSQHENISTASFEEWRSCPCAVQIQLAPPSVDSDVRRWILTEAILSNVGPRTIFPTISSPRAEAIFYILCLYMSLYMC